MQDFRKVVGVALDVLIAAAVLVVISPLFAIVAALVAIESKGQVFYRAHRAGYRGRPLAVLKFTKMVPDDDGLPLTTDGDERFTRVGRVLARTKLDELPQLINVVCGQMALVGPRPEDRQFVALHNDSYEQILSVRPGITGVSQLAYASETSILEQHDPVTDYIERVLPEKVRLDTRYTEHKSLLLDAKVLFWTVAAVVLRRDVAVNRQTLGMTLREHRRQITPRVATTSVPAPTRRPELAAERVAA